MDNTAGFEKTKRLLIGIVDIIILHFSIYLSFLLRYRFTIPYNYEAYREVSPYIFLLFAFLNILFGIYIFYNKTINDMIVLTIIIQAITSVAIMAFTFFGRYFAFPRTIVFLGFVVSTVALSIWRITIYLLYVKLSSRKRVIVLGNKQQCCQAISNFKN